MKKKKKLADRLGPEFWERDRQNMEDLERRVAELDRLLAEKQAARERGESS